MKHDDKVSSDWLTRQLDGKTPTEIVYYIVGRISLAVVVGLCTWAYFAVILGW